MKRIILSCGLILVVIGCSITKPNVQTEQALNLDNCSVAYQKSFDAAVKTEDVEFCLRKTPDPEFTHDGLGGYCFMPHSGDPADFSIINETSFITDCVDMFAQTTKQPTDCAILQNGNYPSSGIGATAYNTCIINYAGVTGDLTACDKLEQKEYDSLGLPDDQECIKVVAWSTHNPQLCNEYLIGTDVYDLCLRGANN